MGIPWSGGSHMKQVSFAIKEEVDQKVNQIAEEQHRSKSSVYRKIVRDYFTELKGEEIEY